jgi:hypothetical protein
MKDLVFIIESSEEDIITASGNNITTKVEHTRKIPLSKIGTIEEQLDFAQELEQTYGKGHFNIHLKETILGKYNTNQIESQLAKIQNITYEALHMEDATMYECTFQNTVTKPTLFVTRHFRPQEDLCIRLGRNRADIDTARKMYETYSAIKTTILPEVKQ